MNQTALAASAGSDACVPLGSAAAGGMRGATLALDIATTTGWALEGTDGYIASGTVSFKNSRYDGGGMRFLRFRRWLEQIDEDAGPIGAVYFEEIRRHVSNDSGQVQGGFVAVLTSWCEEHLVAYQGVPVGTIKRFATGKGNADKAAVIDAMRARGHAPVDDNEADALAMLHWALETRGGVR